jgi:cation transport ATPase
MILLSDDLEAVPDALRLARATFTTIRRNLEPEITTAYPVSAGPRGLC